MAILLVLLTIICLYGIKFSNYHKDYISSRSSNAIKGIFAVIILFSHMRGYIVLGNNLMDTAYVYILSQIGQLMTAIFLFYSGYGIVESIKAKPDYFDTFPRKRILKTVIHFDVAVLAFIIVMTIMGTTYPITNYLTCWIGWTSVGNSCWFVFDILVLYAICYLT